MRIVGDQVQRLCRPMVKSSQPESLTCTGVIGLGAGGHAKVVIEILRTMPGVGVVGLLDRNEALWHTKVLGVPVLGGDQLLPELQARGIRWAFLGVGSVGDSSCRRQLYEMARSHGFKMVSAIHPRAIISPSARMGFGATVMAGAIVSVQAVLGENVIVNTASIIEHDCMIGSHVHIAPGAKLASSVRVGDGTHVGLGACVLQGRKIGRNVVVGAGAVVREDVPDEVTVVGVPARIIRRSGKNE